MRRTFAAALGAATILLVAACTDQAPRQPLAPTTPSLAQSQQCSGNLASDIAKQQKALFTGTDLTTLDNLFTAIKSQCPNVSTAQLLGYVEAMIGFSGAPAAATRAADLAQHLASVSLYVTNSALVRPASVFMTSGGAGVLSPGEDLTTWDEGARLEIQAGTTPSGPHLFTFEPRPLSDCDGTTALAVTGPSNASLRGNGSPCYNLADFPHETSYSPAAHLTLCMKHSYGETGIIHQTAAFNGSSEVLPSVSEPYSCTDFHASLSNSWLNQNGGPLGRALVAAYDYMRPRTLYADDVGESGSIGSFSLVGGALNDIFADNFDDPTNFNDGTDTPDIGDAWTINATHPGFIQIQSALGDMSGGLLVLSQGQGACQNCPVFRVIGTRLNSNQNETVGSYDVSWTSLQNKPSVKEAPFIILNGGNGSEAAREIARLAYVTTSSNNRLVFSVRGNGNNVTTIDVGTWVRDVSQTFTITVNLNVLNNAHDQTVSLSINGVPVAAAQNIAAPRATSLKQVGYILNGIDAGIIGSDNWLVTRLSDIPPP